jgi:hypothetical protein
VLEAAVAKQAQHLLVVPCCVGKGTRGSALAKSVAHALKLPSSAPIQRRLVHAVVDGERLLRLEGQGYHARARIADLFGKLAAAGLVRPLEPETMALAFIGPLVVIRLQHLGSGPPDFKALSVELERHFPHFFQTVRLPSERSLSSLQPRSPRGRAAQARRS